MISLGLFALAFGKFLVEAIDTAVLLDETLFSGIERVAVGASINLDFLQGGASLERRTAGGASDLAGVVFRMDSFFHVVHLLSPYDVLSHREPTYNTQKKRLGQSFSSRNRSLFLIKINYHYIALS